LATGDSVGLGEGVVPTAAAGATNEDTSATVITASWIERVEKDIYLKIDGCEIIL
jgi:hypothetical protein